MRTELGVKPSCSRKVIIESSMTHPRCKEDTFSPNTTHMAHVGGRKPPLVCKEAVPYFFLITIMFAAYD